MDDHSHHQPTSQTSKLKQYQPLIIVLVGILLATGIGQYLLFSYVDLKNSMRLFMGLFFLTFAFFKFLDLKGFAGAYAEYDIIAKRSRTYAFAYPFIELALGISFLANFQPVYANIATIIVMGIGSIGVYQAITKKQQIRCACLGAVIKLPMTTVTLIEDLGMALMAGGMLVI